MSFPKYVHLSIIHAGQDATFPLQVIAPQKTNKQTKQKNHREIDWLKPELHQNYVDCNLLLRMRVHHTLIFYPSYGVNVYIFHDRKKGSMNWMFNPLPNSTLHVALFVMCLHL